jgi:flagellar hook protein FlgE
MIDSIFVAMSGMRGHERALNVISNNVSNMNTPGFRGSLVNFTDVFHGTSDPLIGGPGGRRESSGGGLDASRTILDLRTGDPSQTDRELDLALVGDGFFVLQDDSGATRYTRAGRFDLDDDGELISLGTQLRVMGRDTAGQLVPLSIADLRINPPKATTTVKFGGTLASSGSGTGSEKTIEQLIVFDASGVKHTLRVVFKEDMTTQGPFIDWDVTVFENDVEVGTGSLDFVATNPAPGSSPLRLTLTLQGSDPLDVDFDFDTVRNTPGATTSTLEVLSQDGFTTGTITGRQFDERGVMRLTYSNGQTIDGPRLIVARITDEGGLVERGNALFEYRGTQPVDFHEAGDEVKVRGQAIELSNVDLTLAFSELILMQRGYQASSQVISTANDMLQELLQMRSQR